MIRELATAGLQRHRTLQAKAAPISGTLTLTVHSCTNLVAADSNSYLGAKSASSDPYVIVSMPPAVGAVSQHAVKFQTKRQKRNLNPQWDNETFTFAVTSWQQQHLSVQVFDHDDLSADDPIGDLNVSSTV